MLKTLSKDDLKFKTEQTKNVEQKRRKTSFSKEQVENADLVFGDFSKTMWNLHPSTKFPHQELK